jgi:DNA helicase MCM8
MEQQQVSIAKAGVVASLPARCSVIAAANPKHGSYDMCRTVAENLNMSKPILSRFDLVFILRDRADKVHDRLVSSNIMNLYRPITAVERINSSKPTMFSTSSNQVGTYGIGRCDENSNPSSIHEERMPLSKRLAWVSDIQKQPLPADLVRDYISYAREYCKPQMTQEAAAVLKEYYMELRYVVTSSPSFVFHFQIADPLFYTFFHHPEVTHRMVNENETQSRSQQGNWRH